MGMSLDTTSGVGLLLELKESDYGFEDPSELLEEILSKYSHLAYDVSRFGDWVGGAAVFAYRTAKTTHGVAPILHEGGPLYGLNNSEEEELRNVAEELGLEYYPKYITLVSYW